MATKRVTFTTRLTEAIPRTAGTVSFRFAKPADFTYTAGQWFVLSLPTAGDPLVHSFTYSSSPTEPFLEFTTRLTGSDFKNALLALEPGSEVQMTAPLGNFVLRDGDEHVACLVAGVGVTPIRSILRNLADAGACDREIVVLYGNQSEEGITFREELESIQAQLPGVRIVHVLSRPGEAWQGHKGHVCADIVRAELADPERWTYYVCGPPPMVESTREFLNGLGVQSGKVVVEKFGSSPR